MARPPNQKLSADEIRRRTAALVDEDGPWTAHDIELAPGVRTLGSEVPDFRLRRVVQAVADTAGKPLDRLRVLDLGSLEGQFAIEFALHGAEVVAIEGRETNLRKARFAAEALGAANLEFRKGDVRELDAEDHGSFDAVLCLGILYHLDAPDVMELVEAMAEVCTRTVVVDTHLSLRPRLAVEWRGHRYWGDRWTEYAGGRRSDEEERSLWSSIGNDRSFLLTRASLTNLLRHTGFTSVYECLNPYEHHSPRWPRAPRRGEWVEWPDRTTFIAIKGERQHLLTSPSTDSALERDRPESPKYLQPIRADNAFPFTVGRRLLTGARRLLRRG